MIVFINLFYFTYLLLLFEELILLVKLLNLVNKQLSSLHLN